MDIKDEHLQWILHTIKQEINTPTIYAFGSRVAGTAQQYSDFDVAVDCNEKIPLLALSTLDEKFADSDIPFKIDLIDWHRITPEFQQHILETGQKISDH
ncbi:MAG: nucleotidyltransferase domain-containing protein [Coxiellaceae bacterium]|nr:nucleotidyltransferase domain-containing protein [Coxiellaceae bacterium]